MTRAIGVGDEAEPEFAELTVAGRRPAAALLRRADPLRPRAGDRRLLAAAAEPESACRCADRGALAAGAPDNVSAVVVAIGRER